jgi:hypothetical protein
MKKNPIIIVLALLSVLFFLLGRSCGGRVVEVEKVVPAEPDTITVERLVDRDVPVPVVKWRTKQLPLLNKADVDSLIALLIAEKDSCSANAAMLLSQLILADGSPVPAPVVVDDVKRFKEYSDIVSKPGYTAKWKAEVFGSMESFDLRVDLTERPTTPDPTASNKDQLGIWMSAGAFYGDQLDAVLGLDVQRGKNGLGIGYLPINQGGFISYKRKF